MPTINLVFEDGRTRIFDAMDGETFYNAALRKKIRLETDCLEGACATCKVRCVWGNYTLGDCTEEALTDDEKEQGLLLACQASAVTDCIVEVPYALGTAGNSQSREERDAVVAGVEQVSASVFRLDIETAGEPIVFLPGQYANLQVPGTSLWRSYSFAHACRNAHRLSFYVKRIAGGAMSDYLSMRARSGDAVRVCAPFGHFYLREPAARVVMVSGGTGAAPVMAMLEALSDRKTSVPIDVYVGAQSLDDMFCLDDLRRMARSLPCLNVHPVPMEPGPGHPAPVGFVTDHVDLEACSAKDSDLYLCGPPGMLDAVSRNLRETGAGPRVFQERFLPAC